MQFSDSECVVRVFISVNSHARVRCRFIVQRYLCSMQRSDCEMEILDYCH